MLFHFARKSRDAFPPARSGISQRIFPGEKMFHVEQNRGGRGAFHVEREKGERESVPRGT